MKIATWLTACAFALAFLVNTPARAEIDPAKRAEIEKLVATTGVMNVARQFSSAMVASMIRAIQSTNPKLTDEAATMITHEVDAVVAEHIGELKDQMVAVYDRYYTMDDLRALNQFYSSPVGRKVIATMPTIMRDAMSVGRQWGRSLGPEIERRIKARCATESECAPAAK